MKFIFSFLVSTGILLSFSFQSSLAQGYKTTDFQIRKISTFKPKERKAIYSPRITNLEAPSPDGTSYRSALRRMKKEMNPRAGEKSNETMLNDTLAPPLLIDSFIPKHWRLFVGENGDTLINEVDKFRDGGVPLDNTMAISNDGWLLVSINSKILVHDLKTGLDPKTANIDQWTMESFAEDFDFDGPFDPKAIYDPIADRFIITYLFGGRRSDLSGMILAFSSTNDPTDPWNIYELPGNPFDNDLWSDYPAISISETELFYTINLLQEGSNWKLLFESSLIWQIEKEGGYNGDSLLTSKIWSDVSHNGKNVRNLGVVRGGDKIYGPNMYFLSNRNFDLENDTTFFFEVTNTIASGDATLIAKALVADQPYGLPPNGRQADSDTTNRDDGFDTNDARVLGAVQVDNEIHFVGNSRDFIGANDRAGVYHGVITNIDSDPEIYANIIDGKGMDLGYPNIVFTGTESCRNTFMIGVNHTDTEEPAGISVYRFVHDSLNIGSYSTRMKISADSVTYVDRHGDQDIGRSYERWGDYFGIQRKWNEVGVVYTAGFSGSETTSAADTWVGMLRDCECMTVSVEEVVPSYNECLGQIKANVRDAREPVTYDWKLHDSNEGVIPVDVCNYEYELEVKDAQGCLYADAGSGYKEINAQDGTIYPNPTWDQQISIYFTAGTDASITVNIYNLEGKLIKTILDQKSADSGRNLLTFSIAPLSSGSYIVQVMDRDNELFTRKIVVP